MTDVAATPPEPYVGPRAFRRDEAPIFFGRAGEAQELLSMVVSHRVTLLYAASGMGKSSLLNAGLLPLAERDFELLPPARLATAAVPEQARADNVYALALLGNWDGGSEPDVRLPDWLSARPHVEDSRGMQRPRLLILDQLEELFTLFPRRVHERRPFLEQLAEALERDPLLRVLLGLREDYLAEFDSYEHLFGADGVSARLRLRLLTPEAALEAVLGPPKVLGHPIAPEDAQALVDDLRQVEIAPGDVIVDDAVEPFQLQLACQELWSHTADTRPGQRLGGRVTASNALVRFYEDSIASASTAAGIPVSEIREWVETQMITSLGTRAAVLREESSTAGMPNAVIDSLEQRRLLRAEFRARARWYELTHDRLIETVREANRLVDAEVRRELPSQPVEAPFLEPDLPDLEPSEGIALCVSGGGFRSMLFHAGVIWRLHQTGWLERLDRVTSVSGGSIAAAALALGWAQIGADGVEASFIAPLRAFARRTVDSRSLLVGALTPDTASGRLGKAFRQHLFGDATMQDLPDHPRFVISATSVQTGTPFRFTKPYMVDWRVGRIDHPRVALADVVAASSGSPPLLSPAEIDLRGETWADEEGNDLGHGDYRERAVLTDGALSDPLALESAWRACRTILVSDAAGLMYPEPKPDRDFVRHLSRVVSVFDNQVRVLRKRQTVASFVAGERSGSYWGIASDIDNFNLADALPAPYAATVQLAALPSRFARLDDDLQERLINWGYAACDAALRSQVDPALPPPDEFPYPARGV